MIDFIKGNYYLASEKMYLFTLLKVTHKFIILFQGKKLQISRVGKNV